ncbi:MAG: GntR family transcriptional regulator [Bacillus sp. (in: Bacteria)]|nr:GntR family transcriptional regulator [Bacillus sp. (in: firmicutes)]
MKLNPDETKPIYLQIAEWLENEIISGNIKSDEKIYSQYQLADIFNINPATAAKGLNVLADEKILYKKRGLGMFVMENGKQLILEKRRNQTMRKMVMDLVREAERLQVSEEELIHLIKSMGPNQRGETQ